MLKRAQTHMLSFDHAERDMDGKEPRYMDQSLYIVGLWLCMIWQLDKREDM